MAEQAGAFTSCGPGDGGSHVQRGRPEDRRGGAAQVPRSGGCEPAEDHPVGALRARVRQVVRQHLHEDLGPQERLRGDGRPRQPHRPSCTRSIGSRSPQRARPLPAPFAARRVRGPGHRAGGHHPAGDEEARPDEGARPPVGLQPEDQEVVRLARQLRSRPRPLPAGLVGRGRRAADDVGCGEPGRSEAEGEQPSDRDRDVERARLEHGAHRLPCSASARTSRTPRRR